VTDDTSTHIIAATSTLRIQHLIASRYIRDLTAENAKHAEKLGHEITKDTKTTLVPRWYVRRRGGAAPEYDLDCANTS
jgi:hypothetical protein